MKKLGFAGIALVVVVGGYLALAHFTGGAFPTLGLPIGGEVAKLRGYGNDFMEDIQFKDFAKAASYHEQKLRDTVDIPYLIHRLFLVKPEGLDFMEYEPVLAEVDHTGLRGRVKMRIKVKILLKDEIQEKSLMLYFYRADKHSPWFMRLEDSLRRLKPKDGKKH